MTLIDRSRFVWLIVVAAVGCSDAEPRIGAGAGDGPRSIPVEVVEAVRDTVVESISATGAIEAVQQIDLRPEIDGRLVEIQAREGAEVRRGTPLFRIDDSEIRAQVAQLEAERDLAEQALRRTRELLEQNASSPADLERAEAAARSARAQLELQQVRLDKTVVRAPFSGVVGERFVSVGDYVTSTTRLTTLQTVDPQRAAFTVPERYAGRLQPGQRVSFSVAAIRDREFTGTVDFVDPVVQLPARTITVKAEVPNPDRSLKPGMFVEVRLATDVRPDAVVIPEDAVLPLEGGDYVWVVGEGDVATRREARLGIRMPGRVEVVEGVRPGERVVVGGVERLSEGAPVQPTEVDRRAAG
jgi:membrane fusion protein (multidrug efflux system)